MSTLTPVLPGPNYLAAGIDGIRGPSLAPMAPPTLSSCGLLSRSKDPFHAEGPTHAEDPISHAVPHTSRVPAAYLHQHMLQEGPNTVQVGPVQSDKDLSQTMQPSRVTANGIDHGHSFHQQEAQVRSPFHGCKQSSSVLSSAPSFTFGQV